MSQRERTARYRVKRLVAEPAWERDIQARHRQRRRDAALALYGNKCIRCGFSDHRALQLDHIAGGGNKERAKHGSMHPFLDALLHPEKYQLLCANCNWIKRYENHEVTANSTFSKYYHAG